MEFDSTSDFDPWLFGNPSGFAVVQRSRPFGGLSTITNDNTNSFGFWESPLIRIVSEEEAAANRGVIGEEREIVGAIGPKSLYRLTMTVTSDKTDPGVVPVVRVRTSSVDFQRSDLIVATSVDDFTLSPTTQALVYEHFFSQPAGQNRFRLDFDVLNVDPFDDPDSTLTLENVTVTAFNTDNLTDEAEIQRFDLTVNRDNWIEAPAPELAVLGRPDSFTSGTTGLTIQGSLTDARPGQTIFGSWVLNSDVELVGGRLYRLTWTVTSGATITNRELLPAFRLRLNDETLKFAAETSIDSVNNTVDVPIAGSSRNYDLWVAVPQQVDGSPSILSFDYLYFERAGVGDDARLPITLTNLDIRSYAIPTIEQPAEEAPVE